MAGKSNKGKNRKGSNNGPNPNSSEPVVSSDAPAKDDTNAVETAEADANGAPATFESTGAKPEVESETDSSANQPKQGKILYLSTLFLPLYWHSQMFNWFRV